MSAKLARLSLAPLLELEPEILGKFGLAYRLGFAGRTVCRWVEAGGIPVRDSDAAAVALGHHPADLWPGWCDVCDA